MLTVNISPELGLANGCCGTIVDIIPEPGNEPPYHPRALIVYFPTFRGRSFDSNMPNLVAIPPQTVTYDIGVKKIIRIGFTLRNCHGLSAFKI